MTEEELERKRKEYRDNEVQNKISHFASVEEYRHQTLKINYTRRVVKRDIGKFGWIIILSQATGLLLFSTLFVMSYVPKTKFIVSKFMP